MKPPYILCQHNQKKEFLQAIKATFMWSFFIFIVILYFFNVQRSPKPFPNSNDFTEQFYMKCNFTNQTTVMEFYNLMQNKINAENNLKKWTSLQSTFNFALFFKPEIDLKTYQENYVKINTEYEYQRNLWIKCIEINYEIALSMIKKPKENVMFWMKIELITFAFLSIFLRMFLKSQRRLILKILILYLFVFPICLCMIPIFHIIAKLSSQEEIVEASKNASYIYQCLYSS